MPSWRSLVLLGVLPGGGLLLLAVVAHWLRRRWIAADAARVDALIAANRPTHKKGFDEHDEQLRKRTEARRDAADRIRRRAAHVESGARASDVLRMVK